jgi:hypothetical protein
LNKEHNVKQTTQVYVVADLSGSMIGNKESMLRKMTADFIKTLANGEKQGNQVFEVHLVPFSNTADVKGPWPASAVAPGNIESLTTRWPMGQSTALRDAIGLALERVERRPNIPALVSVFSDGEECASYLYSAARLSVLISKLEKTGNLTLTFAGPASARNLLAGVGVPAGNFQAWDGSAKEMVEVAAATTTAASTYSVLRATGQTSSKAFYADVSQLTSQGIRAMTKKVEPAEIKKVTSRMAGRAIADFYGTKFKPGNHYYELLKPEYLQDDKDLVVFIKDANEYRLGSRAVRTMLGLPETGRIRVRPAQYTDKFQLFIQSSSLNRKVVEGQTMLTVE